MFRVIKGELEIGARWRLRMTSLENQVYKCQTCDKAFAEKHQLKAHLVQHGGDPVEFHICEKRFTTAYSLKRHMAGSHENVRHMSPLKTQITIRD